MPLILASPEQLEWECSRSPALASDVIWKLDVYRSALFLAHVAASDARRVAAERPSDGVAQQLMRSAGSVSANVGEGYSRSTRADRLKFLGYALGSARECVSWYHSCAAALTPSIVENRLLLIARIRALLLGLIRSQRVTLANRGQFEP